MPGVVYAVPMVDQELVIRLRNLHAVALAEANAAGPSSPVARTMLSELGAWLQSSFDVPVNSSGVKWGDVPHGGGGYITNIARDRHSGMLFAGTDVQNGYLRRPGDERWATLFRRDTMREKDMVRTAETNKKGHGLASCMFAWAGTEGRRGYGHINASVFTIDLDPSIPLTETGGIKCRKWNLPPKFMQPNLGTGKFWSPGLAAHPSDIDVVLLGTWNDGCYCSTDAGDNVHSIDIPPGFGWPGSYKGRERYLVWIDQADPSVCYIFVQGTGLHRSTTGVKGPYVLLEGGPKMATNLFCEPDGTLWICADGRVLNELQTGYVSGTLSREAGLWMREGDSFTHVGNPLSKWNYYPWHFAVDPHNSDNLMCWMEQLGAVSLDRGKTWSFFEHPTKASIFPGGEAEWRVRNGVFMGGGFVFTDTPGEIVGGEGFGVIRAENLWTPQSAYDNPTGPKTYRLLAKDMSAGINEFIVNEIWVNPTNGRLFTVNWDRHVTEILDLDAYNARVMMPANTRLSIAHGMDNAIDDPDYYVCSGGSGTPSHSWSQGGEVWTKFATTSDERKICFPDSAGNGSAGAVAMSERDDIVICQSNNLPAVETRKERDPTTGLLIFRQIKLNGSADYSTINSYTTAYRKNVSADKLRPGVFGMVVPMTRPGVRNGIDNPLGGLWVRDGIDSEWMQTRAGRIGSYGEKAQFWNMDFKFIPGREAEMLFTAYIGQANAPLVHLFDDGRRELEIPNVRNVTKFGFGENPGQEYPAVMFLGEWKDERAYWVTLDWFGSCRKLSDEYPNNYWSSGCSSISGDMSNNGFGKWYIAVSGKGAVYAKLR